MPPVESMVIKASQGQQAGHYTLSTDTSASANPSFERQYGRAGGNIDLTWQQFSPKYERETDGRYIERSGPYKMEIIGHLVTTAATAAGTLIGWPVDANEFGQASTEMSQGATITITHQ
jgi:hypothetical protein